MLHVLFLAGAVAAASPATDPAAPNLYRVELAGGQSSWAIGKPQTNGALLLFRHYPDGALMSVRSKDVKRIVEGATPETGKRIKPGEAIEVGATGGLASGAGAGGPASAGGKALSIPPPGARKGRVRSLQSRPGLQPDLGLEARARLDDGVSELAERLRRGSDDRPSSGAVGAGRARGRAQSPEPH
jgi:hypothetical protein